MFEKTFHPSHDIALVINYLILLLNLIHKLTLKSFNLTPCLTLVKKIKMRDLF